MNVNDFDKFARSEFGISSLTLHDVRSAYESYVRPTIVEERKLNAVTMDVFSRLMMDRIIFLGAQIDDDAANIITNLTRAELFLDYEKANGRAFDGFDHGKADIDPVRQGVFAVNLHSEGGTEGLDDKDYFQIRKIQLTYQMPDKIANAMLMKKMSVYLDATTPFRFASNREVLDLKIGSEMSYRTFSIGFKSTF